MPRGAKDGEAGRRPLPDPPQQERAILSTRRLLEAATELLAGHGLDQITLAEVGRRAGYSHGLVTRRFGSKENLLWVLFDSAANQLAEPSIRQALEGEPGLSLVPMLRALRAGLETDALIVRAFYTIMFESLNSSSMPLLRSRMLSFNERLRQGIATAIENGQAAGEANPSVDPWPVADMAVSSLYGAAYQWILSPEYDFLASLDAISDILRAYLTSGIEAGAARPRRTPATGRRLRS